MLSALGYMIISIILILLIAMAGRLFMDLTDKMPENLFMGPLIKEFTDLIIEKARKCIPIEDKSMLLYVVMFVGVALISIVKAVLIR